VPITVTLTAENARDMQAELHTLLFGPPLFGPPLAPSAPYRGVQPSAYCETPAAELTFAPLAGGLSGAPAPTPAEDPAKRGPGRPRKTPEPARVAEKLVFAVRFADGALDSEFDNANQALGALESLVEGADNEAALDALLVANADLLRMSASIRSAIEPVAARMRETIRAEQAERAAPTPQHFGTDGNPLAFLTPDKAGARNGISAYCAAGHTDAVMAHMHSLDMTSVSATPDGDERIGKLVAWLAERLDLPVRSAAEALA